MDYNRAIKLCEFDDIMRVDSITLDNNGTIYFVTECFELWQLSKEAQLEPLLTTFTPVAKRSIAWNHRTNTLFILGHTILEYDTKTRKCEFLQRIWIPPLCDPKKIVVDKESNLYVSHCHCIRKINLAENKFELVAGCKTEQNDHGYKDGTADVAEFSTPQGMAIHEDGTVYVCDSGNGCLRTIKDGMVRTISEVVDFKLDTRRRKKNVYHKDMTQVEHIVRESDGNLIIVSYTGIHRLDANGKFLPCPAVLQNIKDLCSLAIDREDNIYVGTRKALFKVMNTWKYERIIWIGFYKEDASYCWLAALPKDVIREIISEFQNEFSKGFPVIQKCSPVGDFERK